MPEPINVVFDKIKATIMTVSPFLSSLIRKAEIILMEDVPGGIACVDQNDVLYINPNVFTEFDFRDKTFIIGHEILHMAFRDCDRAKNRNALLWNVVTDGVNNEIESSFIKCGDKQRAMIIDLIKIQQILHSVGTDVDVDNLRKMGKEEIYRLFKVGGGQGKQNKSCPNCGSDKIVAEKVVVHQNGKADVTFRCDNCGHKWNETCEIRNRNYDEKPSSGIPVENIEVEGMNKDLQPSMKAGEGGARLQQGDPEIYGKSDPKERGEEWKKATTRAYTQQKIAGTVPAGLQREIDRLLRAQVDWRSRLRQSFKNGMGKTVVSTYRRSSRKLDNFPGTTRFTIPTVHFMVDASGSMGKHEITQAISEVYEIAGLSEVKFFTWDAEAYDEVVAKSKSQVISKVLGKIKGGGGTMILPALKKVLVSMKRLDIVVVFTDGDIYDIEKEEVKDYLSNVASKASATVFLTTSREHNIPRWDMIKIEIKDGE